MSPIIVLCLFVVSAMFRPSLKGDQVAWLTKKIGESQKFNLCTVHSALFSCWYFIHEYEENDDDDWDGDQ